MHDRRATPDPGLTVRRMCWDDVPQILEIARQVPPPLWIRPDFVAVFQSQKTLGFVAAIPERIAGFALCSIRRPPGPTRIVDWLLPWRRSRRRAWLFGLAAAPGADGPEVERYLLEAFDQELRRPGDHVEVPVPETRVSAQAFLRTAGFRAARTLRGYYGGEDAYLMTRARTHGADAGGAEVPAGAVEEQPTGSQ